MSKEALRTLENLVKLVLCNFVRQCLTLWEIVLSVLFLIRPSRCPEIHLRSLAFTEEGRLIL